MVMRKTEFDSFMYDMCVIRGMSHDDALRSLSKLSKYDDILNEYCTVSFAYMGHGQLFEVCVAGKTARDFISSGKSVLDSYLELVRLRDEELARFSSHVV